VEINKVLRRELVELDRG